jgi:hypothetical protein
VEFRRAYDVTDITDLTHQSAVPPWAVTFPRLFEIYQASQHSSLGNWFEQPNVWRGLLDGSRAIELIENDVQLLDSVSWDVFRTKAAKLAHLLDPWGYSRALFDCFNEVKGYQYLLQIGCEDVRFVPEERHAKTPDLRARIGQWTVLMEVKTVNESIGQKNYFDIPGDHRMALESETQLSDALKKKLNEAIERARQQLLALRDASVSRRIVYIVARPDFHVHADDELAEFLRLQSTPEIETVLHLLS